MNICSRPRVQAQRKFAQGCVPLKHSGKDDSGEEYDNNSFGRQRSASLDGRPACSSAVANSRNLFRTHSNGSCEGVHSLTSINEVEGDNNVQLYPSTSNNYPLYRPPVEDNTLLPVRPKTEDFLTFLCLRGQLISIT